MSLHSTDDKFNRTIMKQLDRFVSKITDSSIIRWEGHNEIDDLFLIYLLNKYKSKCLPLYQYNKLFHLGLTIFIDNSKSEFEEASFTGVIGNLVDCIDRGIETIIIPLNIIVRSGDRTTEDDGHANVLIYRKNRNVIERFEPHGGFFLHGEHEPIINGKLSRFISMLNEELINHNIQETLLAFFPAISVCPHIVGLQRIEETDPYAILNDGKQESYGYCSGWSLFFTELALQNPTFSSQELLESLLKNPVTPEYLRNVIRGYVLNINEKLVKYFSILFHEEVSIEYIYNMIETNNRKFKQILHIIKKIEYHKLNPKFNKEKHISDLKIKYEELRNEYAETHDDSLLETIEIIEYTIHVLENINILEEAGDSPQVSPAESEVSSPEESYVSSSDEPTEFTSFYPPPSEESLVFTPLLPVSSAEPVFSNVKPTARSRTKKEYPKKVKRNPKHYYSKKEQKQIYVKGQKVKYDRKKQNSTKGKKP